jgi:iron uptake system component EfeO
MNSGDTAAPPSVSAGAEANPPKSSSAAPSFEKEIAAYRTYVIGQCDSLVKQTDLFVKAIKDGDLEQAKKLYAPTRMYYERIEPIAEALGDLDPNIDARENDVDGKDWRGFHRLEKGLWQENTTRGLETFADRLASDVKLLRAKVETVEIQPVLLVTGAVELLNEVSSSKVTGEEERYSHTDLYDFAANVEGANEIFRILEPELKKKDPDLAGQIGQRFADLNAALAPYKKGDGYVSYTELGAEQTRKLSQSLDALAEPLSQMGRLLGV